MPLQVGARGGALGALGEGAAAVLEVEAVRRSWGGLRLSRRGAGAARCALAATPPGARAAAQALALPLAQAPEVAADLLGVDLAAGQVHVGLAIRRRSSPVSAIHLASTSSESGRRALP